MGLLGRVFGEEVERRFNEATPDVPKRIREVDQARKTARRAQRRAQQEIKRQQRLARERREKQRAERERKRKEQERRERERQKQREREKKERQRRERERRQRRRKREKQERRRKRREKEEREQREREKREREQTKKRSLGGVLGEVAGRNVNALVDTAKGADEARRNLLTGQESVSDVAEGAGQQTLRLMNVAGRGIVDVATGGNAEQFRQDFQQTEQGQRSLKNVEESDALGKAGAVLEAGVDASLDAPGASAQDEVARRLGGRENIAGTYQQAATTADDVLDPLRLSTRRNRVAKAGADFFIEPAVQGAAAVASGTDLETGEKTDATGDDIVEAALLPLAVPGRALSIGARGAKTVLKGGKATSRMVNPLRLLRGLRATDDAADAAQAGRRVTSGAKKTQDATSGTSRTLTGRIQPGSAPRRVETANSNRRSTAIDRVSGSNDGTGSRATGRTRTRQNRPDRRDPREIDTQFGGGPDDAFVNLRQSADGVFRQADDAAVRSGRNVDNLPVAASRQSESVTGQIASLVPASLRGTADNSALQRITGIARRTGDEADEVGDVARRISGGADEAADATRSGSRTGRAAQAGILGSIFARRGDEAGGIFSRIFGRGDEAADATRTGRRGDDASNTRRGDEADGRPRDSESPRRDRDNRERQRTPDEPDTPRRSRDVGPVGTVVRTIRQNLVATGIGALGVGAILGPGTVTVGPGDADPGDLDQPDPKIEGDGWAAYFVKPYNVEAASGAAQVYLYRVTSAAGESLGYSVVLGADESGTIYILEGSPDAPRQGRSRVDAPGLARAEARRAAGGTGSTGAGRRANPASGSRDFAPAGGGR